VVVDLAPKFSMGRIAKAARFADWHAEEVALHVGARALGKTVVLAEDTLVLEEKVGWVSERGQGGEGVAGGDVGVRVVGGKGVVGKGGRVAEGVGRVRVVAVVRRDRWGRG
jgi:hypothetical protein